MDTIIDDDDEKCIAFIKSKFPAELQGRFNDDQLYYCLDALYDYYTTSGVLDEEPGKDRCVEIDVDTVADYLEKETKKDGIGEFTHDEMCFIVQTELDYNDSLDTTE